MASSRYFCDVGEAACLKPIRLCAVTSVNVTGDGACGAGRGGFVEGVPLSYERAVRRSCAPSVCWLKRVIAVSSKKSERARQLAARNDRRRFLRLLPIYDLEDSINAENRRNLPGRDVARCWRHPFSSFANHPHRSIFTELAFSQATLRFVPRRSLQRSEADAVKGEVVVPSDPGFHFG